jgi:hypothetical protein
MSKEALSITERLLALLLVHDMHDASQGAKIVMLDRAGLANGDIAELLGTTPAVVRQSVYEGKRKPAKKASKTARRRAR